MNSRDKDKILELGERTISLAETDAQLEDRLSTLEGSNKRLWEIVCRAQTEAINNLDQRLRNLEHPVNEEAEEPVSEESRKQIRYRLGTIMLNTAALIRGLHEIDVRKMAEEGLTLNDMMVCRIAETILRVTEETLKIMDNSDSGELSPNSSFPNKVVDHI